MSKNEKLFSPEMNSPLYRLLLNRKTDEKALERRIGTVDKVLTLITAGIIAFSFIWMLAVYRTLPEKMGVHFLGMREIRENLGIKETYRLILHGGVQEYDVTASKLLVFYPHLISFLALVFSKLFLQLVEKLSKKDSADEYSKIKLKQALILSSDIAVFDVCIYFCVIWTWCVLRQVGMRMIFTFLYVLLIFMPLFDLIFFSFHIKRLQKVVSK